MKKLERQFLYVELSEMQKDLESMSSSRLSRSCHDIQLDHPAATSGTYTIDPNQGSAKDAIKTYCTFGGQGFSSQTCVSNSTGHSQLSYLNLLHTRVSQTIQLPCSAQGPFRMAPFDASDDLEVPLSKSQEVHVDVSKCNAYDMMREVEFKSDNIVKRTLPFSQPIHYNSQNYYFKDICFY